MGRKYIVAALFITGFIMMIFYGCKKDAEINGGLEEKEYAILSAELNIPSKPFNYGEIDIHEDYKGPLELAADNMPGNNVTTAWGATLGRVLFYEKELSVNRTISCASCHQQMKGFSDPRPKSQGHSGGLTGRHSMALGNARYYQRGTFFWDERASTLEDQVLRPIQDAVEMGLTLTEAQRRLRKKEIYGILFQKAFGDTAINDTRMAFALAQFVRSLITVNSKFDKGLLSTQNLMEPFPNFTQQENHGKSLFYNFQRVKCGSCHGGHIQILDNPRNNGVDKGDSGVYLTTGLPRHIGAFKSPSLRNIAVRPPYMHDGFFPNLMSVVEHYNSALSNEYGHLDPHLVDGQGNAIKMNLSQNEKQALVAFMQTLTDEEFLNDEKFSDPFK